MLIDKDSTSIDVFLQILSTKNNINVKKEDIKKIVSIETNTNYNTKVNVMFDGGVVIPFSYDRLYFDDVIKNRVGIDILTEYLWSKSRSLLSNDINISDVIGNGLKDLMSKTTFKNYWLYDLDKVNIKAAVSPDFKDIKIEFNSLVFTGELNLNGLPVSRAYDSRVPEVLEFNILEEHSTDSKICFEQHFYNFIRSIGLAGNYGHVQNTYDIVYTETEDLELNSVLIRCKEDDKIGVIKKFNKIDLKSVLNFDSLTNELKNIVRINRNNYQDMISESIKCFSNYISKKVNVINGPYANALNKITCQYKDNTLEFWIPSVVYKHNYIISL